MKRFYVNPNIIDTNNMKYNIIEPEVDIVPESDDNGEYEYGEQVSVEIVTESGNWDSVGYIKGIYTDEFGVLLSVDVDWGQAVLIASEV